MKRNDITPFSLLLNGTICIVSGFFLIFRPIMAAGMIYRVALILICVVAVVSTISFIIGREQKFLRQGIAYVIAAAFIVFTPKLFASSLSTLFAFISAFNGVVNLISFVLFKHDNVKQWRIKLLLAVVSFGFTLFLLSNPLGSITTISKISGCYLLFLSLTFFGDFTMDFLNTDYAKDKIRPRVYMAVPTFIAAMLPRKVLKGINDIISNNEFDIAKGYEYVPSGNPRLEVYLHIGNDAIGKFGHMDICFDNVVYSYGCYDHHTNKIAGMVSDGTLAVTPREPYLYQSIDVEKKTLIGFGIDVNAKEGENIQARIDDLGLLLLAWKPDSQLDLEKGGKGQGFTDPASVLYNNTGAKFFKFAKGKFKTYFALGSNCVLLAHQIVGSAGAGVLRVGGLVTPGTYYAYLDRLYNNKNTFVVNKTVYKMGEKYEESIDHRRLPK